MNRTASPSDPRQAAWLLSALILLALAYLIGVVDPIKYELIAAKQQGIGMIDAARQSLINNIVGLAGGGLLLAGLLVALVRGEWKSGDLSALLADAPKALFWLPAIALLVWFSQGYLYPGFLLPGDTGSHMVRAIHTGRAFSEGEMPFWSNHFYMGAPFLEFYAPLFYWGAGAFYALTGSMEWGPKGFLLVANLVAGIGMYGFVRALGESRFAAMVAGLVYAGSWAHGHLILQQGPLPLQLAMAWIPLLFWAGERLFQARGAFGWSWAATALCAGGAIATHQPHGVFAGLYLALYLAARWGLSDRDWRVLPGLLSAGALGVAMALFAVVPHLLEQSYVVSHADAQPPHLTVPSLEYLATLLTWSNMKSSLAPKSAAYLGLSVVLLAGYAVYRWRRGPSPAGGKRLWLPLFGLGLLLSLGLRGMLMRDVIFTLFFLAPLAGAGAGALVGTRRHAPAIVLAVLMLDLGSTAIQPLARAEKVYLLEAGQYFADHHADERLARSNTREGNGDDGKPIMDMGPSGGVDLYPAVQNVGGPHNHAATPIHNYVVSLLKIAEASLRANRGLDDTANIALAVLNVSMVSNDDGFRMGFPADFTDARTEGPLGRVLRVRHPTPVLFSTRLTPVQGDPDLMRPMFWSEDFAEDSAATRTMRDYVRQVLDGMSIDLAARTAATIPVRDLTAPEGAGTTDRPLEIVDYRVGRQRVTLAIDAPADGWVQLAHPWYPAQRVLHDGKAVEPLVGAFGFLVLPAHAGHNDYLVEPTYTPLRVQMAWLSGGALLFTLALASIVSLRNRTPRQHESQP